MTSGLKLSLVSLLILALLGGCTVLPERTPKNNFMLPAPQLERTGQQAIPLTLRILTPQAESPFDGTRILVSPEGESIQAYRNARWNMPTPILIRDHWVEALRQSGGLKAVVSETSDAMSDLSLASDLSRFHIYYEKGQPRVLIKLDAQILESGSRRVLAARRFRLNQPITDQPVEAVVAGFGKANETIAKELAAWVLSLSRELYAETDQARPL